MDWWYDSRFGSTPPTSHRYVSGLIPDKAVFAIVQPSHLEIVEMAHSFGVVAQPSLARALPWNGDSGMSVLSTLAREEKKLPGVVIRHSYQR